MTEGPILSKLFKFLIPFVIVNFTQILYNAIDIAILGNFSGDDAVAAVGATSVIISLLTGLASGFSSGVNIVVARCVGSKSPDRAKQTTGTALITAIISSLAVAVVGIPLVPAILTWMKCDPLVLDTSTIYLRIILCAIPFQWVYNFLASSIRATGNSSRPMAIMLISGGFKVLINLLLIGYLQMGVVGAGISTILSHLIAASQALYTVTRRRDTYYTLERSNLRLRKNLLADIVRYGVPASLSSICFYFASAVVQSTVNSMGKATMTANAVSAQWDTFIYTSGNAVAVATMAFVSQNIGARKFDRVKKALWIGVILATVIPLAIGGGISLFADELCGITTDNPEIIEIAKSRLLLFCFTFFIGSIMEVIAYTLIAMGYTKNHLVVSVIFGLGFRSLWAKVIWSFFGTLGGLYAVIPVGSALCFVEYLIVYFFFAVPKLNRESAEDALHSKIS